MQAAAERLEFAPPPTRGWTPALVLAIAAHALLVAALTWGVNWKRDSVSVITAELWSAVPQEAAPAPVPEPPAPPPAPPSPQAAPEPPAKAPEVDADIALEREKKRQRLERIDEIRKKQEERLKLAALEKEKQKQAVLDKEKQRLEQIERDKKQAQDKRERQLKAETQREQLDAQRIEASRQEQLKRMMAGVAGATGTSEATGTAKQSAAPSAGYAGKIVERIRNNTSFTDANAGKPTVIVDVRVSASGAIMSRRVTQTSGNRAYDDAVLKAIDKMEFVPKDSDGRIPALVLSEGLELKVTL